MFIPLWTVGLHNSSRQHIIKYIYIQYIYIILNILPDSKHFKQLQIIKLLLNCIFFYKLNTSLIK